MSIPKIGEFGLVRGMPVCELLHHFIPVELVLVWRWALHLRSFLKCLLRGGLALLHRVVSSWGFYLHLRDWRALAVHIGGVLDSVLLAWLELLVLRVGSQLHCLAIIEIIRVDSSLSCPISIIRATCIASNCRFSVKCILNFLGSHRALLSESERRPGIHRELPHKLTILTHFFGLVKLGRLLLPILILKLVVLVLSRSLLELLRIELLGLMLAELLILVVLLVELLLWGLVELLLLSESVELSRLLLLLAILLLTVLVVRLLLLLVVLLLLLRLLAVWVLIIRNRVFRLDAIVWAVE